jgi:hypothetical protein
MKFTGVVLSVLLSVAVADPTRPLTQTAAEVRPHASLMEVDELAARTAESAKLFHEAMGKLQGDEERFRAKAHYYADEASRLKADAGNIII